MPDSSRLVMSQGPQPGQTFMLDQDTISLGRDPSNNIVIDSPQASRQHARITRQGNLMVIEDLGSTNGTFVNGVRLTDPHTLANNDVLGLGDAVRLTYYGASAEAGAGIAETETLVGQPSAPHQRATAAPPPSQPAPQPAWSAPAPPPPSPVAPPSYRTPPKKSNIGRWIGCGCVALIVLACVGSGVFIWYAPASFWQTLIDFGIPIPALPF